MPPARRRPAVWSSLFVALSLLTVSFAQQKSAPTLLSDPFPQARRDFRFRDRDGNGQLSPEEFCGPRDNPQFRQWQRDFQLLDLNADGVMSFDEFRTHPLLSVRDERGPFPSRISRHVDELMEKFDSMLPQWDLDHDGELDRTEQGESRFYPTFDEELPQRERDITDDGLPTQQIRVVPHTIDRNNDGVITRDEVRQALEISYGLRRFYGEPARLESGLVYNWMLFRHCDELQPDDRLTRNDFVSRGDFGDLVDKSFDDADSNKDSFVTFAEWCTLPSLVIDPILDFMQADKDFDGRVSPDELLKSVPEWQLGIARHVFPGFDVDGNGWLSIFEYQSTPLCDHVYKWQDPRREWRFNNQLSRYEFNWEPNNYKTPRPTGLLHDYFQCYDIDRNGWLSHDELEFITPQPPESRIYRMSAEGDDVELLVNSGLLDATYLGSPDLSPDGKSLLFDATPAQGINNNYSMSHVVRLELEGPDRGQTFDLGLGNCPDWSPDGTRIAFFVNTGNPDNLRSGVWVANRDGTGRRLLALNLRAPRWSPDGKKILCTNSSGSPHKLFLVDVEKGQRESILDEVVVLGIPDWDPTGKRIAVSLYIDSNRSMCLVDIDRNPLTVTEVWKTKLETNPRGLFDNTRPNWTSDGQKIIFTDNSKGTSQLFQVGTTGQPMPEVIRRAIAHADVNAVWSSDRKQIYFCSTQPIDKVPKLKNPTTPFARAPEPRPIKRNP